MEEIKKEGIQQEVFDLYDDTTPRYDKAAATLAWDRTIAFFKEKLK